jgi:anthranilate/para-aminobenzoate synthase component I
MLLSIVLVSYTMVVDLITNDIETITSTVSVEVEAIVGLEPIFNN